MHTKSTMTKCAALISGISLIALAAAPSLAQQNPAPTKRATAATKAANEAVQKALPFSDKEDFENATRGL